MCIKYLKPVHMYLVGGSDVLMDVTGFFEVPFYSCFYNFQIQVSVCVSLSSWVNPGILLVYLVTQRRTQKGTPGL